MNHIYQGTEGLVYSGNTIETFSVSGDFNSVFVSQQENNNAINSLIVEGGGSNHIYIDQADSSTLESLTVTGTGAESFVTIDQSGTGNTITTASIDVTGGTGSEEFPNGLILLQSGDVNIINSATIAGVENNQIYITQSGDSNEISADIAGGADNLITAVQSGDFNFADLGITAGSNNTVTLNQYSDNDSATVQIGGSNCTATITQGNVPAPF